MIRENMSSQKNKYWKRLESEVRYKYIIKKILSENREYDKERYPEHKPIREKLPMIAL